MGENSLKNQTLLYYVTLSLKKMLPDLIHGLMIFRQSRQQSEKIVSQICFKFFGYMDALKIGLWGRKKNNQ